MAANPNEAMDEGEMIKNLDCVLALETVESKAKVAKGRRGRPHKSNARKGGGGRRAAEITRRSEAAKRLGRHPKNGESGKKPMAKPPKSRASKKRVPSVDGSATLSQIRSEVFDGSLTLAQIMAEGRRERPEADPSDDEGSMTLAQMALVPWVDGSITIAQIMAEGRRERPEAVKRARGESATAASLIKPRAKRPRVEASSNLSRLRSIAKDPTSKFAFMDATVSFFTEIRPRLLSDVSLSMEEIREETPTALILTFLIEEPETLPSVADLVGIFGRFGPIRDDGVDVMADASRAEVVFRYRDDAERALYCAGNYIVFGRSAVSYRLRYSPTKRDSNSEVQDQQGTESQSTVHEREL